MNKAIAILHYIPGRIRLHIPAIKGLSTELIERAFTAIPGVREVNVVPLIQSVTLHYDPSEVTQSTILYSANVLFNAEVKMPVAHVKGGDGNINLHETIQAAMLFAASYTFKSSPGYEKLIKYAVTLIFSSQSTEGHAERTQSDLVKETMSFLGSNGSIPGLAAAFLIHVIEMLRTRRRQADITYHYQTMTQKSMKQTVSYSFFAP